MKWIVEAVFSVLRSSFTRMGLHFIHYPAGQSNATAPRANWNRVKINQDVRYSTPFLERMGADSRSLEDLKEEEDRVKEVEEEEELK